MTPLLLERGVLILPLVHQVVVPDMRVVRVVELHVMALQAIV